MTMHSNTLATVLALVLVGSIATARAAQPAGREGGPRPRPPIDTTLDADGNEVIDAGEIANAIAALQKLDANADGQLTPDEYRPPRPGRGPGGQATAAPGLPSGSARPLHGEGGMTGGPADGRRPLPPIVTALDANGDGEIDPDEIANAVAALKKLDVNGDGTLSPEEYRPPRPSGSGAPDGKGGPSGSQHPLNN